MQDIRAYSVDYGGKIVTEKLQIIYLQKCISPGTIFNPLCQAVSDRQTLVFNIAGSDSTLKSKSSVNCEIVKS